MMGLDSSAYVPDVVLFAPAYTTNMDCLSTPPTWIVCLHHQHGLSVYTTNMDCLSTPPTWIVCLHHQHGLSVYHTNPKLAAA